MEFFAHELETLIEKKIREAEEKGMFKNLPTAGKKLNLDVNPFAEEEWRLAFKMLKDNGVAPEFVVRRREIESIRNEMGQLRGEARRGIEWRYRDLLEKLAKSVKALNGSLLRENHFVQGSLQVAPIDVEAEMAEFEKGISQAPL